MFNSPDRIDKIISDYKERLPVIKDLQKHHIKIEDLDEMQNKEKFKSEWKIIIPILMKWLNHKSLSNKTKGTIAALLAINKSAKKVYFKEIIDIYTDFLKSYDRVNQYDEYAIGLGNILLKWVDDSDIELVLKLLKEVNYVDKGFILKTLLNLKNKENQKKVLPILKDILKNPNINTEPKQFAKELYSKFYNNVKLL